MESQKREKACLLASVEGGTGIRVSWRYAFRVNRETGKEELVCVPYPAK